MSEVTQIELPLATDVRWIVQNSQLVSIALVSANCASNPELLKSHAAEQMQVQFNPAIGWAQNDEAINFMVAFEVSSRD